MLKIVATLALVAVCNAGYVGQYILPQQPLTLAHQPAYLAHGAHIGYPIQYAKPLVALPAPTTAAPAPAPTTTTAAPAPEEPFDSNPQYTYEYKVDDDKTDDHKSATETRNGDSVSGKYTVVEPDGTIRTVTYTAGKDGFVADVQRDASKAAPAPAPAPAPTPAPAPAPAPVPVQPALKYFTVPAPAYHPIKAIHHAPIHSYVQPQLVAQSHIVAHPQILASHGHHYPYVLH